MKTESQSISYVLSQNRTSFYIPPFQRAYAWGLPEIERYFHDVVRIIDSELDVDQEYKLEHFFGTIVIKEEKSGFASRSIVIDGQQRLTTTLLFLIALRDLEENEQAIDFIHNSFLTNANSTFSDKIKLKQVTTDWESYRALVNGAPSDASGNTLRAYRHFSTLLKRHRHEHPQITAEHYIIAIERMNVAVIFLDERPHKGEDPQIIFETLNSLGKPLTLSDLVRNFVLLQMPSEEQTEIYEKIWHPKVENVLTEDTSKLFRDYLQRKRHSSLKVVNDNNTKELYSQFKSYVDNEFSSRKDFITDIVRYVPWYKAIIYREHGVKLSPVAKTNDEICELLENIFHDIKTEAFKPLVLGLLEYHQDKPHAEKISDDQLVEALKTIRTYLIRRRVLGLTSGENKAIVLLCERLKDLQKGTTSMLDLLSAQGYNLRMPNDAEMEKMLREMELYAELKKYTKFILGKIAQHESHLPIDYRNSNIRVQRIMPEKLTGHWREALGEQYEEVHKTLRHNIGNMILSEFNFETGRKPFQKIKEELSKSALYYRIPILSYEAWNEDAMVDFREKMIKSFLRTFPLPESHQQASNWNSAVSDTNVLSPMDVDSSEFVTGTRPLEVTVLGETIPVKTWQNVYLEFLKLIKTNFAEDFDAIVANQSAVLQSDKSVIPLRVLYELAEEKPQLLEGYKTLDEKLVKELSNPMDDMRFFNIRLSSSTIMNRLENIMNYLYLDPGDVQIRLR